MASSMPAPRSSGWLTETPSEAFSTSSMPLCSGSSPVAPKRMVASPPVRNGTVMPRSVCVLSPEAAGFGVSVRVMPVLPSRNGSKRACVSLSDSRASEGEIDNSPLLLKVAQLRAQRAELLGYESHAHYILETRMAKTPQGARAIWPAPAPGPTRARSGTTGRRERP